MRLYPGLTQEDHDKIKHIAVADIETTGLVIGDAEVLTCAVIMCDYRTLSPIGGKVFKFRPRYPKNWKEDAVRIHGITFEEAMSYPEASASANHMMDWVKSICEDQPIPFACHAMKPFKQGESYFDYGHMRRLYYDLGMDKQGAYDHFVFEKIFPYKMVQSTVTWARALVKDGVLPTENAKLDTLCKHFDIRLDHHNAVSDTKACRELLSKFRGM